MKKVVFFFILLALLFPSTNSIKADYWKERITFHTGTVVDLGVAIESSVLTNGNHGINISLKLINQASGVADYQNTSVEYKLNDRFSSVVTFPSMSFAELSNSSTFQYSESWGYVNLSVYLFSVETMHHEDDHYLSSGWIVFYTINPPYTPDTEGVSGFCVAIVGVAIIVGIVIFRTLKKKEL